VAFEGDEDSGSGEEDVEAFEPRDLANGAGDAAARRRRGEGIAGGGSGDEEDQEDGEELAVKDRVVVDEGVSDLDYLRSRMRATLEEEEEEEEEEELEGGEAQGQGGSDEGDEEAEDGGGEEEEGGGADEEGGGGGEFDAAARGDQAGVGPSGGGGGGRGGGGGDLERQILDTGRLFVRNLAYDTTEADVSEAFGRFGGLEEVHLVLDRWERDVRSEI
jgi:multiple RNA-binding domain-containing protein 1